jgi:hypothetical protein
LFIKLWTSKKGGGGGREGIVLIGAKLVTMGKISKYGSLSFFKRALMRLDCTEIQFSLFLATWYLSS